jgi:sortase A
MSIFKNLSRIRRPSIMTKMMRKLISVFFVFALPISMSVPAFAYNYNYSSGADYGSALGKPTSTDALVTQDPMTANVRRNKDAAYYPPGYGVFSGDIPTDPTSPYHDNSPPYSGYTGNPSAGAYGSGSASNLDGIGGSVSPMTGSDYGGMLPPTSIAAQSPDIASTAPLYYDDGSIGTLSIPKLNLTVKVYEGETLENMRVGVGHFEFTSAWDGNVGVAGHNRGVPVAIGGIKDLKDGDEIIYATKYGTRAYVVYSKTQITDTDYSYLGWSDTNIITMITCVQNTPGVRWCVQARQK